MDKYADESKVMLRCFDRRVEYMVVCSMLTTSFQTPKKDEKNRGSRLRWGHFEPEHLEAHMRGFRGCGHDGHDGLKIIPN